MDDSRDSVVSIREGIALARYHCSIESRGVGLTKQAFCSFECDKRRKRQVDWAVTSVQNMMKRLRA